MATEAWADIQGDEVTFHNVRNCDCRTETDYTPHWRRATCASRRSPHRPRVNYWGSPWIAHPSPTNSLTRRRSASPSRYAKAAKPTRLLGLYRHLNSSTSWLIGDVIRLRTITARRCLSLPHHGFASAGRGRFPEKIVGATLCGPNRAGIAPSPLTAPRAFAQHPRERVPWDSRILLSSGATN